MFVPGTLFKLLELMKASTIGAPTPLPKKKQKTEILFFSKYERKRGGEKKLGT